MCLVTCKNSETDIATCTDQAIQLGCVLRVDIDGREGVELRTHVALVSLIVLLIVIFNVTPNVVHLVISATGSAAATILVAVARRCDVRVVFAHLTRHRFK